MLNFFLNFGIVLIVVVPVALLSRFIMSAYGLGFEDGESVLRVLAFSAVLVATNKVIGQANISKGKMWIGFAFNTLWAIVLLIAATTLLHKGYGALGLAYATLIAYSLHIIWQSVYFITFLGKNVNATVP